MKENVLIVHNYYQIPGGEDTVVSNESELLKKNGHKVIIYSRNNSELNKMNFLRKLLLPFTTIFNIITFIDVIKIIKKENIDIVHVHNTLNLISPAVYYAAKTMKVPIAQTIHNFRLLCPGATLYRDNKICERCIEKNLLEALKYKCYRGSLLQTGICVLSTKLHRITGIYKNLNYICLTEFNKNKLLQLNGIREEQVFIKPNFVTKRKSNQILNIRNNIYIYAGRLDLLKGVDILYEAWKTIEHKMGTDAPKLIVCGTGPLDGWCKEFISTNNIRNIQMLGFVPNDQTMQLISECKALILPTRWYEGFPMTIVEAYSVGTPVIGSSIGNTGVVIKDGVTGYKISEGSVESLVDCILNNKINEIDNDLVYKEYSSKYIENINYECLVSIYQSIKRGYKNE